MNTLSIRTDMMSNAIQQNLSYSTDKFNLAMQRLASGLKINSAKDGAANLNISTKMGSTISGLEVANSNINTGISTLSTVNSTYDLITTELQKIRDLAIQASNGTYSADDCAAINEESNQLIAEVNRLIKKSNELISSSDFISNIDQITKAQALAAGYDEAHIITSATDFVSKINANKAGSFILVNDIDMSKLETLPDSAITEEFTGTFDGNGYSMNNLSCPLFDRFYEGTVKNLGLNNVKISNEMGRLGALANEAEYGATITNCYATGTIAGTPEDVGGLIGFAYDATITNSYFKGSVTGNRSVGGLVGDAWDSTISNCYSKANVNGLNDNYYTGGLVGSFRNGTLNHVNSSGIVVSDGSYYAGGLIGYAGSALISDSYSTTTVSVKESRAGGFVGYISDASITNSYATGDVSGTGFLGGFIGEVSDTEINSAYSTGDATGTGNNVGGFIGYVSFNYDKNIKNVYATGNISGNSNIGGLIGTVNNGNIENAYATGDVYASDTYSMAAGGFVGTYYDGDIKSAYATGDVAGTDYVGGFVGQYYDGATQNAYATGSVSGANEIGGFAGTVYGATVADSYSSGLVSGSTYTGGFLGRQYSGSVDNTNAWNTITSGQSTTAGNAVGVTSYILPTITVEGNWDNAGCKIENKQMTLQTGTEKTDTYTIDNLKINIDLSGVDLSDATKASDSLSIIDSSLSTISKQSTSLGSSIKILENKVDVNNTQSINLTQSNSTLKDADTAEETVQLVQQQILQQTNAYLLNENRGRLKEILLDLINQGG